MKNKNVKFDSNVPNWVRIAMSEEFCMGWNPVKENEDIYVKFIEHRNFEEIIMTVNDEAYEFDRFSRCYFLVK